MKIHGVRRTKSGSSRTYGLAGYYLFERGEPKEYAVMSADGTCTYSGEACAPDDPRFLA